ncbi:MAG: GNAT family N-acetyltransferase [Ignavibacteria bacterium]|nr:GNAT family N-acetyltransferase [Ignavibacteria bacterium]
METLNDIQIIEALTDSDYNTAKELFLEYASELGFDLCFQNFEEELKQLRMQYGRPTGILYLVKYGDSFAGCAGVRKFSDGICELKRMYIRNSLRGKGTGRLLLNRTFEGALELGYRIMRLDTLPLMKTAITMYEKSGFRETETYRLNPVEGAKYYEKNLNEN